MPSQMLAPAAVLVLWSLVMLTWLSVSRLPALSKMGGVGNMPPGGRGQNLEGVLPDRINWKSHNYTHLMEQPTLFYAVSAILAITGATLLDVRLAWSYVGLRIVHSVWQSMINTIPVRITLFSLSSIVLLILALRALAVTFSF